MCTSKYMYHERCVHSWSIVRALNAVIERIRDKAVTSVITCKKQEYMIDNSMQLHATTTNFRLPIGQ